MGGWDSLYTVYQVARVTVPTFLDAARGSLTIENSDLRLRQFAARVVEHADIEVEIIGTQNVPSGRACVFMSNHQSHFDIPILYYSLPIRTLRMVAKTELFRVPLWGRAMRAAGMIEINRSDRSSAIVSLGRAADALARGISIWIAPEGRRESSGKLGPLKKGGFHLARDTESAIIPIAISGTGRVLPRGTVVISAGRRVRVVIGEPIATDRRDISELAAEVESFLRANIETGPL